MSQGNELEKIVVAVNKRLEPGRALNAASHALLGLCWQSDDLKQFALIDYPTSDADHFLASKLPLIVLRASDGHLKRLLGDLRTAGLPGVGFHSEMTGGSWEEQLARSAEKSLEEIDLFAVATIGAPEQINPLTKRCSLY